MGVMTVSSQNFMEIDMPGWWLSGASVDLDFRNGRYYDSSNVLAGLSNLLSISRASIGYAQNSSGTLVQFPSGAFRVTDLGLLIEDARTNVVLWSGDLTNAAWVKTNVTAVQDQVGADGVVNGATSLLATAGNGTVLQSITLASAAQFQSAWVKRLVGTGTVNMTMDNGATWTAITITPNWTQVTIPGQTLANPTVGFRIVTSGDQIAVDFVQNEAGGFASSPIPTTTTSATRATDAVTAVASSTLETTLKGASGSVFVADAETIVTHVIWQRIGGPSYLYQNGSQLNFYDDTAGGTVGMTPGFTAGVPYKAGCSWDAGGRSVAWNGTTATGGVALTAASGAVLLLSGNIATVPAFTFFQRFTVWNTRLADATLQALTKP